MGRKDVVRPDGPPARLPSKLPPPGDFCLSVSLQERLGWGRVGSVYPLSLTEHLNLPQTHSHLPSLVVKIAASRRSEDLAREAWFYEEMEHLQGVSIARCYGFFQAEVPDDCEILSWADRDETSEEEVLDTESNNMAAPLPGVGHMSVSVLVLERLGDHIPLGASVESIQCVLLISFPCRAGLIFSRPDVVEIYNDIGRLGIEHIDVRWRNVVRAPVIPESLVCPYHGHRHGWRIIDFDCARKSDQLSDPIDYDHQSWLTEIFRNLPDGNVIDCDLD